MILLTSIIQTMKDANDEVGLAQAKEIVEDSVIRLCLDEEDEDAQPYGAYRIYFGYDAYKVDLPNQEEFYETKRAAKDRIDEINKDSGNIQLSYDSIEFDVYDQEWEGKSWDDWEAREEA